MKCLINEHDTFVVYDSLGEGAGWEAHHLPVYACWELYEIPQYGGEPRFCTTFRSLPEARDYAIRSFT